MSNIYFTDKSNRPILIKKYIEFIENNNLPITSKSILIKKLNNGTCFNKDFKVFSTMKQALKYNK
tara:strand:- start:208 stop:402 length:195 start_codon:yes stop_codon:yes gene_type:complete